LTGGLKNAHAFFEDRTYLELITFDDREKASDIAAFLEKHEGTWFIGLEVSSADKTVEFLRSRGLDVKDPQGGTVIREEYNDIPAESWRLVEFRKPVVPDDVVFFIEYTRAREDWLRKHPERDPKNFIHHPNTAKRLVSAWMAVKDLEAVTKAYELIGLPSGRRISFPQLGARGREIMAGGGVILLLEPTTPKGIVASFLSDRGETIMGVSIEVSSLAEARRIIEVNSKQQYKTYAGLFGQSILIPAGLANGAWIELFQRKRA
jgi:hypothetical protein